MAKIFIEESTLTSIGDAIRSKEGTSELVPVNDMASRISAISGGGGGVEVEPVVLSEDCSYACAGALAGTYINKFGNTVTTKDITNASYMFYNNKFITRIPFNLNFKSNKNSLFGMFEGCTQLIEIPNFTVIPSSYQDMSQFFRYCESLKNLPYVYNAYPGSMSNFFYGCQNLRIIPDDYFNTWNNSRIISYSYSESPSIFYNCYSLRKIPTSFYEFFTDTFSSTSSNMYYQTFNNCYVLDEVTDISVNTATFTSNSFSKSFQNCYRLKRLTFKTNEDGTPKTAKWKGQTIELTTNFGYTQTSYVPHITKYNSGITADKQVTDDASYQALKNDPDWFTSDPRYSRYNHDSAVETINSLPDTSAYLATQSSGTNTIKFRGTYSGKVVGELTDGGAINTLTEEEIAVATAKGWTVTLS